MGWNISLRARARRAGACLLMASALSVAAMAARAQAPCPTSYYYADAGTTAPFLYLSLCGPEVAVAVGLGADVGGSFGVSTSTANTTDPRSTILGFGNEVLQSTDTAFLGSRVFVRVDGGKFGGLGGYDYDFGYDPEYGSTTAEPGPGYWIEPPTLVGSHIEARWATLETTFTSPGGTTTGTGTGSGSGTGTGTGSGSGTGTGTGTGTTGTAIVNNPQIEIDMKLSFVHDQVRFAFNIINGDTRSHTVGLCFVQEIEPIPNSIGLGVPIKIPGQPYIRHEVALTGSQVPAYYVTEDQVSSTTVHSIKALLRPTGTSLNDPTPPTRMVVGNLLALEGNNALSTTVRDYEEIWNYTPVTSQATDQSSFNDEGVALFWNPQPVPPGNVATPTSVITYIGANTSDFDLGQPLALAVSAPQALGVTTNASGVSSPTPNPFSITAYVQNGLDLISTSNIPISPVNLTLQLPQGLTLAAGDTTNKQITSLPTGSESSVSWSVVPDGTATGTLTYTVTANPSFGNAKTVQRNIIVPAPVGFTFKGSADSNGLYQMYTIPLQTGSATPSTVLYPTLPSDIVAPDTAKYDPSTGSYNPVSSFTPGQAYWLKSRQANDQVISINSSLYPPLTNSIQPNATTYTIDYPEGWNQIGSPYIYGVPFSEQQVFDPITLKILTLDQAGDPTVDLILPTIYAYDTSNADPAQWHYVLESNLGFIMQPFQGYWLYVKKPNLQFIYTGIDTVGASITATRAALVGANLGSQTSRVTANNWKLRLTATGKSGMDLYTYVGVTPKATDSRDNYKYTKPPVINKQVTLDIVHTDWPGNVRYAQDIRSPAVGVKTWNLQVTSVKANDQVEVAWPELLASVPHNVTLTLIDPETNNRYNMRNRSSYQVTTDGSGVRNLQVVAETGGVGHVQITSFTTATSSRGAGQGPAAVAVNYTLSGPADTYLTIRDGSGRMVRRLQPQTRVSGTQTNGSVVWDLHNDRGTSVASGLYTLELTVISPSGDQAKQTRPCLLIR